MNCPNCHQSFEKPPGGQIPYTCPHCQSHVLGVYCDLTLIGSGAMGDVYRGLRPDMGRRTVAIKLPKAAEARVCSRFEREIAASARLRHENIICAFDRGEEEGRPYLVMEYVSGRVLSDLVDTEHPLSAAESARILRQVAAGLGHAAQQKIVNRDIKPDNVLITADGTAKILDYGLALIAELDGSSDRVTRNGTLLGTPGFLAPEQAIDPRGVSIAADVYALGCTAHYLLTRRPPFTGKDSFAILKQHATAPRPSVRAKRPDVDVALDELIQRMMAVSPDSRPSPRELVQLLDRMIPQLNAARPSLAGPASGMLDARCPNCQEVYHLRADMVGKRMQCRNKLCGERFIVEPVLGETILYSDQLAQAPPTINVPREGLAAVFAGEPLEAEAVDAEALDAEPMDAEAVDAEAVDAEAVEAEPIEPEIAEAEAAEDSFAPPTIPQLWGVQPEVVAAPPIAEAEAVADDAEPVDDLAGSEVETVFASEVKIDTPLEGPLQVVGAAALEPPPGAPATPSPSGWSSGHAQTTAAPPTPAPVPKPEKPPRKALTPAEKRKRRIRSIGLGSVAAMAVAGAAFWYFWPKPLTPQERWDKAIATYREDRQWGRAKKEFNKFEEEFPEDEHLPEIPYFLAMCDVGDLIYSDAYRGRRGEALAAAKKIFEDHRDNPAYQEYSGDLFESLKLLVGHFLKDAQTATPPRMELLAQAREAHELLKTVGEGVKEDEKAQSSSEIQSLDQQIVQTEATVREALARLEVLAELKKAQSKEPLSDIDGLYAKVEGLLSSYEKLAADKELLDLKKQAWLSEQDRVRYVPAAEGDAVLAPATPTGSAVQDLFVVWDPRQASPPAIRRPQVLTALSRGVMYVFDAQGNFLWARRLGVDSYRLPLHTPATPTSPAAVVCVSTEDNTLLSLDAEGGRILWTYKAGGDISSPLTIVSVPGGRNEPEKQRGLLPTADGNINVLELVLGKQLGRFEIGHPLAPVGGGYDAINRLAYFPADNQRVFAINPLAIDYPEQPACKAVLFTEHASGSLRSEPTIVDRSTPEFPQAYMIVAEATDLEMMKLRIFDISTAALANPRAPPINQKKETVLKGWSWSSPLAFPDRITLVTDAGELGVFGLNLDNRQESIYRIVEGDSMRLPVRDRFRSLAIDSDERYLWVMAGGTLRKLKLDVLGQQIRPLWPTTSQPAEVTGVPLHEAQLDERGDHLFLSLMSTDGGHFDFVAVDARHGKPVWQRQLGVKLFGDPLPTGEQVLLLDHSGRTVLLDPESSQTIYQPNSEATLPAGADPQQLIRIADDAGGAHLAVPLADGRELAIASLASPESGALVWERIPLPEALQGRPCICGDFLIAPCADGILRRVPLRPGVSVAINEQPFHWMPGLNKAPGPERADVYALGKTSILLVAAGRDIRRLEIHDVQNVTRWRQVGGSFESESPLLGEVLTIGDQALATDITGTVYGFDIADPGKGRGAWKLGGRPTSLPFLRGDKLLAVVESRKLVAIAPSSAENDQPLWSTEPFRGRIRGQPVLSGDVLLVADESRRVTAVQLADGQPAWFGRLPARIGPVAAAVPFGKDRILVPLADGTFSVVPKPAVEKQVAQSKTE